MKLYNKSIEVVIKMQPLWRHLAISILALGLRSNRPAKTQHLLVVQAVNLNLLGVQG
jgi:hypothetical protein